MEKLLDLPEKPEEKDYIIAYIDLLGTRELIKKTNDNDAFENIYYVFLSATKIIPNVKVFNYDNLKIKVFSDNILVALEVDDLKSKESVYTSYDNLTDFLYYFLHMILNNGFFFRGAITLNKLLINDIMVWGSGLSEVVYLEENIANYPRIILSEKLLSVFDKYNLDGVKYEEKFKCLKDFDGCVFFDFFDYNDWGMMDQLLKNIQQCINEVLLNEQNPKILQKYCWLQSYIDRAIEIYDEVKSLYY